METRGKPQEAKRRGPAGSRPYVPLPARIAAVALAFRHGRLRVAAPVGGQRLADVDHLLELPFRVAADVALVSRVRLDELSFIGHLLPPFCLSLPTAAWGRPRSPATMRPPPAGPRRTAWRAARRSGSPCRRAPWPRR